MNRTMLGLALAGGLAMSAPAFAALAPGATAPDFKTTITVGGKHSQFSLRKALKKQAVVLYFYPAAFTKICTIEAHNFAAATDEFKANGALVIGVSEDPIDKLDGFSTQECQAKFPLATDSGPIMKDYDAVNTKFAGKAARTSYVIARNGKVVFALGEPNAAASDPNAHVAQTMAAVKALKAR